MYFICEINCIVYEVCEICYWGVYIVLGGVVYFFVDIFIYEYFLVIDKVEVFWYCYFEVI